jgi:glycosyltransferase involved in cell wall biosynthesis
MLSIVICTRNRAELLKICIESLLSQQYHSLKYEIIVADNNSEDDTRKIVFKFIKEHSIIKYVKVTRIGSSAARNEGILQSSFPWLAFIDDDGKVKDDFLKQVEFIFNNYNFDCFGGWFTPWYRTPKPKWLPDSFGSYPCFHNKISILSEKNQHLPAGIMLVKRDIFYKAGGFSELLGMKGNAIGYGEENFLQDRIRELGGVIGFSPYLILEHLVSEYKYKVSWHLNRNFAKGRDFQKPFGSPRLYFKVLLFFKLFIYSILLFFKNLPKLILTKKYFWQNWLIDSTAYPLQLLGKISV